VSAARDEILARVRTALPSPTENETPPRNYRRRGDRDERQRIALLTERLEDYGARVERVSLDGVGPMVGKIVGDARIGVPPAWPAAWRPSGAVEDGGLPVRELDKLDGALTGCALAIAETGTLVLAGGRGEGRRALTLVPDLHVCVVRAEQIVETVPEAFDRLERQDRPLLTFVSGPSATSDIELSRVEGVHGPRSLVVVIVEGWPSVA
jgi:L-lactate dehydrogenase complex protein LldG